MEQIKLTNKDLGMLANLLENPPEPNEALKKAHAEFIRNKSNKPHIKKLSNGTYKAKLNCLCGYGDTPLAAYNNWMALYGHSIKIIPLDRLPRSFA